MTMHTEKYIFWVWDSYKLPWKHYCQMYIQLNKSVLSIQFNSIEQKTWFRCTLSWNIYLMNFWNIQCRWRNLLSFRVDARISKFDFFVFQLETLIHFVVLFITLTDLKTVTTMLIPGTTLIKNGSSNVPK